MRREGGRSSAPGVFSVTGSLAGIRGPGRRFVSSLQLRRLAPDADLSVLAAFRDLEELELDQVSRLDLAPLAGLRLKCLTISRASGLELGPINELPALEVLTLTDIDDCTFPRLRLPRTLRGLTIANDDPALTGESVRQAIEAIEWERLGGLRALDLRVGGTADTAPIEVDLGFLFHLPALEQLDLSAGVHNSGPGPAPVDPPFDGLSRHLTFCRLTAWDRDSVHTALCAYLRAEVDDPDTGPVTVYQRSGRSVGPTYIPEPVSGPGRHRHRAEDAAS